MDGVAVYLYSVTMFADLVNPVNFYLDTIPKMLPVQIKMARSALGIGVRDLAALSGITANTISRIENGADAKQSTITAIRTALESQGIEFIPANASSTSGGPGVRLRS